jgi:hypothetical protein
MTSDMLAVAWRYYEALLHPDSPIYVAESKHASGLGLFARNTSTVEVSEVFAPAHLYGIIHVVTEEHFSALRSVSHPSLYWDELSILYGPLSLVNHECGSLLCFSRPRKIVTTQRQAAGQAVALEEFDGQLAVYAKSIDEEGCHVKKNQEITIDYFNTGDNKDHDNDKETAFNGAKCRCRTCSK